MRKAAHLIVVYNVFWGLVQIYKLIEFIYSVNITQNTLMQKPFITFTIFSMILVIPFNAVQPFLSKYQTVWAHKPYLASFIFVCITYLCTFGYILFL